MKRLFISLFVVFVALLSAGTWSSASKAAGTAILPAGQGNVPDSMEGMWKGIIKKEGDGMYDITFQIMENALTYRTGIVNYPTQECGGELFLVGPKTDEKGRKGVEMTETLTRKGSCTEGSVFFFYMDGENMRLTWTVKDRPEMKGTAKLVKHGKGVGSGAGE